MCRGLSNNAGCRGADNNYLQKVPPHYQGYVWKQGVRGVTFNEGSTFFQYCPGALLLTIITTWRIKKVKRFKSCVFFGCFFVCGEIIFCRYWLLCSLQHNFSRSLGNLNNCRFLRLMGITKSSTLACGHAYALIKIQVYFLQTLSCSLNSLGYSCTATHSLHFTTEKLHTAK